MPFLARAHPCSKLDHTNRHLSYAVSTNSETQTLHSDYAALLLRLDSLQHTPSIVTGAAVVDTDNGWMRSMCFTLSLILGHLVQHKNSEFSTPIV